mgnify:CR=1 FL=1
MWIPLGEYQFAEISVASDQDPLFAVDGLEYLSILNTLRNILGDDEYTVAESSEQQSQPRVGALVEQESQPRLWVHSLPTDSIVGVDHITSIRQNGFDIVHGQSGIGGKKVVEVEIPCQMVEHDLNGDTSAADHGFANENAWILNDPFFSRR